MAWTPERIEELTQLWNAGHSASAIGKKLGVSKNAVVGKAHRLNLPARPSPIRRDSKPAQPARKPAPVLKTPPPMPAAPAKEERRRPPMVRVQQQQEKSTGRRCQWPIGDPATPDFHFCEAPAAGGKPYCAEHCAVAYVVKSRDRSSEAA
ncbi:GcrA family cell cycle regulator [Aquibaculum arenosum]|uniref:GcrA family cell cycle regulator n=1 Tax=Aquibaculum arenosum TaxID=3032591 RepID=A0ABT5YPG4_9PROT|nr:GcrA family cell cycle regulator [Fodinicurvata sp. CAU 1616]MDF2096861.1 GcrA family cell cycle regulator [Fodinicurvata sp. CAU 1616]